MNQFHPTPFNVHNTAVRSVFLFVLLLLPVLLTAAIPAKFEELDKKSYNSQTDTLADIAVLRNDEPEEPDLLWLDVMQAKTLYHLNRFAESQSLLIKVESASEGSDDHNLKEMTLRLMGQNFYRMGGFDQAMTHALKAKLIAEKYHLSAEQAQLTNIIAAIHLRSGKFDLALINFQKALNYFESVDAKNDVAKLKNNMAAVYIETNEFDLADRLLQDALTLAIELNRPTTTISALVNQIELEVKKNNFNQAKLVFNTCLDRAANENLPSFEVWCLEAGAEMYQNQGDYIQAIEAAKKAYQMAGDQKLFQSQINLGKIMVDLYSQTKQFELAIEVSSTNLIQVEAIKDEVLKLKLEEVSALNDVEKTQSQLSFERKQNKLHQKNQRLTWLGIMILIPILLIALLLLKSKQRLVRALNIQQSETIDALKKMRKAKELNEKMAKTDSLTGLLNRREMLRVIETISDDKNFDFNSFVLMIDVDHFKVINDQFGHATGDKVLVQLAKVISESTPHNTPISRWGGEEFLVFLHHCDEFEATAVADNLLTTIADTTIDEQLAIQITVSMGISQSQPGYSITDWINRADEALYLSKKNGRNQVTSGELLNNKKTI